jgi:IS605 OrfB family transposase
MIVLDHATAQRRMLASGPLAEAFRALALASNNLANVAIEIVSRVLESHRDGVLMPLAVLSPRQLAALALANAAIDQVNATRRGKNLRKAAHNEGLKEGEKPREPSRLFAQMGEPGSAPWDVADLSVLDQACRLHRDETGASSYEALGACEAPLTVASVAHSFAAYRQGIMGHPRPLRPGASRVVEFPAPSFARRSGKLPPLSKPDGSLRPLFLDRAKTLPLSQESREAFEALESADLVARFRDMLRLDESKARFLRMRLVHKHGRAWLEGVFEVERDIPDGSLMARALAAKAAAQAEKAAAKELRIAQALAKKNMAQKPAAKQAKPPELGKADSDKLWAEALAKAWRDGPRPSVAGIDLGIVNVATAAFSGGRKSAVFSGQALERATACIDVEIDRRKSILARDPAIATLQRKAAEGKGTAREKGELARRLSQAYGADPKLRQLWDRRACVVKNFAHQLTCRLAAMMACEGVEAVAVGRNAGWKDGADMGPTQNRRFHAIPHATIISMLRSKLAARGILLVEVEESYSSQASFASNEPLRSFGKAAKPAAGPEAFIRHPKVGGAPATPAKARPLGRPGDGRGGVRARVGAVGPMNVFNTSKQGRWSSIHADANGAFNILRKACPGFARHGGLSSAFELILPRGLGPAPVRTTTLKGRRACAKKKDGNSFPTPARRKAGSEAHTP